MPISPQEAEDKLADNTKTDPDYRAQVERIDEALSTDGRRPLYIDVEGVPSHIVIALEEAYDAKGWDVSRSPGFDRDGLALIFDKRR